MLLSLSSPPLVLLPLSPPEMEVGKFPKSTLMPKFIRDLITLN